ncbi:MAG TPA: hydroxyacid dehydrogenase [Amaricoccus sp.]|nr:hydroxyacid dehydrogenase [Amaricoccus sp.]
MKPLVLVAPEPRELGQIFTPAALATLRDRYRLHEVDAVAVASLPREMLAEARYILGQPPLDADAIAAMTSLRAILNVESNLLQNMPYAPLFERGIHVLTTGQVFAQPVAEIGLGFALALARQIVDADLAFREGREAWGLDGTRMSRLLMGSDVGLVGYGDLGRALRRLLTPFRTRLRVFDPWLPDAVIAEAGAEPASLDTVLSQSDFIFVVAAVTSENEGFLGTAAFARMRPGAAFILLSRAGVVDFDGLIAAVAAGRIVAASDVYPEEPLPRDHPVRSLPGFLHSAHRAGALSAALTRMGDMVLDDMALMDRGLPPVRLKRAERETVARMRSKPVEKT